MNTAQVEEGNTEKAKSGGASPTGVFAGDAESSAPTPIVVPILPTKPTRSAPTPVRFCFFHYIM